MRYDTKCSEATESGNILRYDTKCSETTESGRWLTKKNDRRPCMCPEYKMIGKRCILGDTATFIRNKIYKPVEKNE